MSRPWASDALRLLADAGAAAMVTMVGVSGSAPREPGARMIVGATDVVGTIGGGNLEYIAIAQARRLLAQASIDAVRQDYPLGPLLGQCCGGRVRLLIERLDARSVGWLGIVQAAEMSGSRYTLEGRVAEEGMARSVRLGWDCGVESVELFTAAGGVAARNAPWSRIVERVAPAATELWLFGAGHVGKAVARIMRTLPVRLTWLDTREGLLEPGLMVRADAVAAVKQPPPGTHFLVMTHSHDLDFELVQAILARGDAAFCGLIGSVTKRMRFANRLERAGVSPAGLTCPIGTGITRSKDPACIAVAITADLLTRLEVRARGEDRDGRLTALESR